MAEGLASSVAEDNIEASSAGIMPIGLHPVTVASMLEIGIDISDNESVMINREMIDESDIIITVCNSAQLRLPLIPASKKYIHWDISNPDRIYDSEEERMEGFAIIRNKLKGLIKELLEDINNGHHQ